jgi:hypothetical protein
MTPPPSEKSGLAKDLIVILGLPALLLSGLTIGLIEGASCLDNLLGIG